MRLTFTPRTKILYAAIGLVAVFLGLAATVGSLPGVCASCHAMKPFAEELEQSAHADVSCYACHATPTRGGWLGFKALEITRMYIPGALGVEIGGPSTRTERGRCLRCHENVLMATIESGVRINHGTCASQGTCDTCHSAVAHGVATRWITEPMMEDCIACHRDEGATTACDRCHAAKTGEQRLSTGPWAVTHGANWERTHGMGDLRTCDACHEGARCAACHQVELPHAAGFGQTHSTDAIAYPDSCNQCHDRTSFCTPCHGLEMPHPATFLATHMDAAHGYEDPACMTCHYQQDCDACHVTHTHPGNTDGTIGDTLPKVGE